MLHGGLDSDAMGRAYAALAETVIAALYPVVARELAGSKRHDAIICLGAVIRGDTPHFDYVAGEAAKGLGQVAAQTGVPVAFGVLTCETMEQALARAGGDKRDQGRHAAEAVMAMADLRAELSSL